MKKSLISFLIGLFTLSFIGCEENDPIVPGLIKSELDISSQPLGANIIINNQNNNQTTPSTIPNLEPGFYKVQLSLEHYLDTSFYLTIARNKGGKCNVEMRETPSYWWKRYDKSATGLLSVLINKILKSDNADVIILTADRGIITLKNDVFTYLNSSNSSIPSDNIRDIVFDTDNSLWMATDVGLVHYTNGTFITYNKNNTNLPENYITSLSFDSKHNLYIGTYNSGLVKFDGVSFKVFNPDNSGLSSLGITSILVDKNDVVWIGTTTDGVVRYDNTNFGYFNSVYSGLSSNYIREMHFDSKQQLWVSCGIKPYEGGISMLNKTGKYSNFFFYETMNVVGFDIDSKDVLWIGTSTNGAIRFDGTRTVYFNRANSGIYSNTVTSVLCGKDGFKWFAAYGLSKYLNTSR